MLLPLLDLEEGRERVGVCKRSGGYFQPVEEGESGERSDEFSCPHPKTNLTPAIIFDHPNAC